MSLFEAWLVFVSPGTVTAVGVISFLALVGCGFVSFAAMCETDNQLSDEEDKAYQTAKTFFKLALTAVFVFTLTFFYPSQNQMYAMIGGYYGTNIEGVEELPANTVRYLNEKLTEHLEENKDVEE